MEDFKVQNINLFFIFFNSTQTWNQSRVIFYKNILSIWKYKDEQICIQIDGWNITIFYISTHLPAIN